ncbi:GNAT family N-acetyltransferase [Sinorhizobium meliloti]|uniref:GNAT family N-acetyltransferase n=1 Tax=Rhizobium meliloti TaxID=382 RepID=UPI003D648BE8
MKVRPLHPDDLTQLHLLCTEHAEYEGAAVEDSDQAQRWSFAFFASPPQLYGWVCSESGAAVDVLEGYMTASVAMSTWSAKPYVFLDCIYLKPRIRRHGVGKIMLSLLEEFACGRGCQEIQWQTIPSNKTAAAFYKSIGAVPLTKTRWTLRVGQLIRTAETPT